MNNCVMKADCIEITSAVKIVKTVSEEHAKKEFGEGILKRRL